MYAYQDPKIDLPAAVLDALDLPSGGVVADVGCGNGRYLAELARRGFDGRVLGADMSAGMLAAARERGSYAALVNADATALPLATASVDLLLAMHMLYHVPDPLDAVREFRRVTRPGGTVVVGLNGADHLIEFRAAISAASASRERFERVHLDDGETLLGSVFGTVTRHDFVSAVLPPPAAIAAYVHSRSESQQLPDAEPLVARVLSLLFPHGPCLPITTHCGILSCEVPR